MAPKKQKAQKMALTDFFAETTGGSWADDDYLPSAPAAKDPSAPKRGDAGYLDSMPDRGARAFSGAPQGREDLPLPTAPPYTAYVGNLTFETDEAELLDFFTDLNPVTSRLVKAEGKSKGFGYVEFPSVEALQAALDRTGAQLGGRSIRMSVAESQSKREGGPSAAEESSQWRRTGPLPAREAAPAARRGQSFTTSSPAEPGQERDWGAARGSKFTPSPQMQQSEFRRETSGPGRLREELGPSHADEASVWRSAKPLVDVSRAAAAPGRVSEQSSPGLADSESTWTRGSKLRTPVAPEAPLRSGTTSPVEREWTRGKALADSAQNSGDGESPRLPAAPLERRKLNLAPRSGAPAESPTIASPSGRSSIFGGAQPIDSAAKEAAAADKLKQQDSERRQAAQKARDDEDRKIKELADERERSIKEALAAAGVPSVPSGGEGRPERGQGGPGGRGRGGYGGPGGPGGPNRRVSHDRPPHQSQQRDRPAPQQQRSQRDTTPSTPQVDADGFEIAGSGRAVKSVPSSTPIGQSSATGPAGQPRKDVKKGFSFSAAVAQGGFADDADEAGEKIVSSEKANGGANGDAAVEEARQGVEDVKV